jgi:hypothetical protein
MPPMALLNTAICTAPGDYTIREITADEAYSMRMTAGTLSDEQGGVDPPFVSAIGHQATADALSEILGTKVSVNRIAFVQEPGQEAIVLKLRGRLPEGQILDRAALDEIGYDLWLMTRTA